MLTDFSYSITIMFIYIESTKYNTYDKGPSGKFYTYIRATSFGVCNRERVALRDRAYYTCIL